MSIFSPLLAADLHHFDVAEIAKPSPEVRGIANVVPFARLLHACLRARITPLTMPFAGRTRFLAEHGLVIAMRSPGETDFI